MNEFIRVEDEDIVNTVKTLNEIVELFRRKMLLEDEYKDIARKRYVLADAKEFQQDRSLYATFIYLEQPYDVYSELRFSRTIQNASIGIVMRKQNIVLEIFDEDTGSRSHPEKTIYLDNISLFDIYELAINEKKYKTLTKIQEHLQNNIDSLTKSIDMLKRIVAIMDMLLK